MNYQETIALAERGSTRPEAKSGKGLPRRGIVIAALGFALSLGLYPFGFNSGYNYPLHLGLGCWGGFVPLFPGLGLMLLHYLTEK